MSLRPVEIEILGRVFKFNCPDEEAEALTLAADDLTLRLQRLKQQTNITNFEQLLITAALNISYELTKEKISDRTIEIEKRAKILCTKLDSAFNQQSN